MLLLLLLLLMLLLLLLLHLRTSPTRLHTTCCRYLRAASHPVTV